MKKIWIAFLMISALWACSRKAAPAAKSAAPAAVNGAMLYARNCSGCHGAEGVSNRNPNLQKTPLTAAQIETVIKNGIGRMPAFEDKLTVAEVSGLALYAHRLKR